MRLQQVENDTTSSGPVASMIDIKISLGRPIKVGIVLTCFDIQVVYKASILASAGAGFRMILP